MLSKITESCRFLLQHFPDAQQCQDYLDSRLNKDSQELFQFGYFPNAAGLQVLLDLVGTDSLKEYNLMYTRELSESQYTTILPSRGLNICYFEDFPLVMPFRDPYGNVVALVGRTLLSEKDRLEKKIPKYKNTKPFLKGHNVFGLYENKQSILDQNCVYVVEGQFDVIKAVEKGFKNIVAIGSNNLTTYQFSVMSRYTNNIFLLLDNDESGEKGRKRAVDKFGKLANIRNFYLPVEYKDIDEFLSKNELNALSFEFKD